MMEKGGEKGGEGKTGVGREIGGEGEIVWEGRRERGCTFMLVCASEGLTRLLLPHHTATTPVEKAPHDNPAARAAYRI